MRKIFLFMMISLDGFIEGPGHDLSWHHVDEEFNDFAARQMEEADTILFGRRTYQLMENFWPSKEGIEEDPEIAQKMNNTPKVVVSHSLEKVEETDTWKNVSLIRENVAEQVARLKGEEGKAIVVLGSNNLCVTLLGLGLLDELRIMVNPVVIGEGTPLFHGVKNKLDLKLIHSREFHNGNMLLTYEPVQ